MSSPRTSGDPARAAAKALAHAVRRSFIHKLMATEEPLSASAHATDHALPLSSVSYHVRVLATLGVIEAVETVSHRRTTEPRYRLGGPICRSALAMLPVIDQLASGGGGISPPQGREGP